jgi:hypothetical protein
VLQLLLAVDDTETVDDGSEGYDGSDSGGRGSGSDGSSDGGGGGTDTEGCDGAAGDEDVGGAEGPGAKRRRRT